MRNGPLHPLYRGVYAVGHANLPLEGRFLAAVKACGPTAVLSHVSAAALYDLVRWDYRYPEVTTRTDRTHRGIRVHRSSMPKFRHDPRQGHPDTTPARTLIDLAATLDYPALRRAVRQAQRHLVSSADARRTLDRLGPRRGTANLGRILATGHAPTRSELEDTVLDLILNAGFNVLHVNVPIDSRRPHDHPRLPLARPAPRHRGRRRRMARQPPHPPGRRRKASHPRSPRRARPARHLGPGDRPSRPDPDPHPRRRSADLESTSDDLDESVLKRVPIHIIAHLAQPRTSHSWAHVA